MPETFKQFPKTRVILDCTTTELFVHAPDFYRGWDDYEEGFGSPDGEYWLGLSNIYRLAQQSTWELRVDLQDFDDNIAYAAYESFSISDAASNYRLSIGAYSGNAGDLDALRIHNNSQFSTLDRDNDKWYGDCAADHQGGWWYEACESSNLNGLYLGSGQYSNAGMMWFYWKNSFEVLKRSEMKMRRIFN